MHIALLVLLLSRVFRSGGDVQIIVSQIAVVRVPMQL